LPPQICIVPSDTILDRFELIQQAIIRLPEDWEKAAPANIDVRRDIPERIQNNIEVVRPAGALPFCRLRRYEGLDDDLARLPPALAEFRQFADTIVGVHLKTIADDIEKFRQSAPRRKAMLQKLFARVEELTQTNCDLLPLGINPLETASGGATSEGLINRVESALTEAESSYSLLLNHFQGYVEKLDARIRLVEELRTNRALAPEELFEKLVHQVYDPAYECDKSRVVTLDVAEDITRELIELQLLQARARAEAIELQEVDLRAEQAVEVARRYRRDWMNARSVLVDSWRLVQFNADPQSNLDFFSGNIRNISDNPFRLRADTGTLHGRAVRRTHHAWPKPQSIPPGPHRIPAVLRNFYNFEDGVARDLRACLRQLTTNSINFELQPRRSLRPHARSFSTPSSTRSAAKRHHPRHCPRVTPSRPSPTC
jgi:hypothetical protein